jgi:UDP-glucose 4-epimerase
VSKVVVVTGASGYIGGETMLRLRDHGHTVIGIDTRRPPAHLMNVPDRFYQEGFSTRAALDVISKFLPDAVIHCAGTSLVGPSISNPKKYYDNNFINTKTLLDHMISHGIRSRVIFSSSAAVYGDPQQVPCREDDRTTPISPYGESKVMTEMMLSSYSHAHNLDYVAFRYFNACGADSQGRHGQAPGATHIIARVLESLRDDREFFLNGADYATADGTCVRDYVHVEDIAQAHLMATYAVVPADVYNLGSAQGISNLEIINRAQTVTKRSIKVIDGPKRVGDPGILTASAEKYHAVSGWNPKFGLDEMISHAWAWYTR